MATHKIQINQSALKSYKLLKAISIESEILFSFLNLLIEIYSADIHTNRKEGDTIHLLVPIASSIDTDVIKELELIVNYMCNGETFWILEGYSSHITLPELNEFFPLSGKVSQNVCLFSGGVDSYCGIYNNKVKNIDSFYVNYKTNNFELTSNLKKFLRSQIDISKLLNYSFSTKKIFHSQRTRTLLFMAIAFAVAENMNINEIFLFENGIFTLNPNLNHSRRTTKTTHPKVLYGLNKIMKELDINIYVSNPFVFKTKAEIINELNDDFKANIKYTMTCGASRKNPKFDNSNNRHCGVCPACVFRQISMSAFDNEIYDADYDFNIYQKLDKNHPQFSEFRSSYSYFKNLSSQIANEKIMDNIDINKKYYLCDTYYNDTLSMLNNFNKEFEIFQKKYYNE